MYHSVPRYHARARTASYRTINWFSSRRVGGGTPIPGRSHLLVHASLLLVAVFWGSNFVSIKYLLNTVSPGNLVLLRLVLASLVFLPIVLLLARGIPRIERADIPMVLLIAVLGITINTSAIAFGTQLIPAAVASLIVTGNPVFTALISRALVGEPLTVRKMVGVAIAFLGFLIVLLYGGQEAQFSVRNALGVLITMGGPIAWAFYTVLSKPLQGRYHPVQFVGLTTVAGTLPLIPFALLNPGLVTVTLDFGATQWLALTVSAILALVAAYLLWYRGLSVLEPTQIAVYVYLVPVFGAVGAWLLLGERITIFVLLGGLTILSGVIITNTTRLGPVNRWLRGNRGDQTTAARTSAARTEPADQANEGH
jgi:drug/metabolite transporter (DMT)-like permease